MAASRRRWTRGERVEVYARYGTVVGEHLDGPFVRYDGEPADSEPHRVYWRDAWLIPTTNTAK